ncbi:hypothetical protein HOY82DRAFT_612528 [Tuber indicum]|nr:hypothetical protein HOY82DRAFT_612528 [Tuber indicum]
MRLKSSGTDSHKVFLNRKKEFINFEHHFPPPQPPTSKSTIILSPPTSTAKRGKKSRPKARPSKSTSLVYAEPAPSERTDDGVLVLKEAAEEEFLEKLIFGDSEGFEDGLNEVDGGDSDDSDEGGIPLVRDRNGNEDAGADLQALQDEEEIEEDLPAWQDSDDEPRTISLANRGLLSKLRDTETENFISGKEYFARLCRQKARLHGTGEGSSDEQMDGIGVEEAGNQEVLRSAPSLEKLLGSTTNWTHTALGRLRPGQLTIDKPTAINHLGNRVQQVTKVIPPQTAKLPLLPKQGSPGSSAKSGGHFRPWE